MALPPDIPPEYSGTYTLFNYIYKAALQIGNPMALPPDIPIPLGYCGTYLMWNYIYKALFAIGSNPSLPTGNSNGEMIFWDNNTMQWDLTNSPSVGFIPRFDGVSMVMDNILFNTSGDPIFNIETDELFDTVGNLSIDIDNKRLDNSNGEIVNWQSAIFNDSNANPSADFDARQFSDSGSLISLDFNTREAINDLGNIVIEWNTGRLNDNDGDVAQVLNNRNLIRKDGVEFLNYNSGFGVFTNNVTSADVVPTGAVEFNTGNGIVYKLLHS